MEVEKLTGERDRHKKLLHDAKMTAVKEMHSVQEDRVPGNVDQYEDGAHDLRVAQLTKEKQDLQAKLAAVESDYNTLNGKFKSMQKRLKSTGAAIKEEMSDAIVKASREYFKKYLWPRKKLLDTQDTEEVEELVKSIYNGIKVAQKFEEEGRYQMDFDEFQRVYTKMITEHVSSMRSTCQNACKETVMGK